MQPHALTLFAERLAEEHGPPEVLDVERSIQVHKPSLTGSISHASYYVRPPEGMPAEQLIELFESVEGYERMNLTLTSILGLDTYHQPLISVDDFAKKYFAANTIRIVRVVGRSDSAIEAMAAFVDGLKRPFSAEEFPHHSEFAVSGYRAAAAGKSAEVKLLFTPADPTLLMRVEREVNLHLAECNLAREITASRHYTREQPPELILASTADTPRAYAYLEALANSLPRASQEDVAEALLGSARTPTASVQESQTVRPHFAKDIKITLPAEELRGRVVALLAGIMRTSWSDREVEVVQRGTAIEIDFPRSAAKLWIGSSFDEKKHIGEVKKALAGVRADPLLREGWELHYHFDGKKLQLRPVDSGTRPAAGVKAV